MRLENRVKRISVNPELFPLMFATGSKLMVKYGIPLGAKFRGFAHDYQRNCIVVFIEHESFEPVAEGAQCPEMDPIQMERLS